MHRLLATIPPARIARYEAACGDSGLDPIDLYLWAGRVSSAVFDDLVHLEVALRSTIAEQLYAAYGPRWYRREDIFDHPTVKLIKSAWESGRLDTLDAADDVVHGKLVATLMFGFWVRLLGKGAKMGQERRIYDTLVWKAGVRKAFPHVGDGERSRVERSARTVRDLRNRIAHHEHIVWGVPLLGQVAPDKTALRMSVSEAMETVIRLAGFMNEGLASWLLEHSTVAQRIEECPLEGRDSFLL